MNVLTTESFINWCDNMKIAEEFLGFGKKKKNGKEKKKKYYYDFSVSKAVDVTTEDEMKQEIHGEETAIHLTGPKAHQLLNIFRNMQSDAKNSYRESQLNKFVREDNATAYKYRKDYEEKRQSLMYHVDEYNGETYLLIAYYNLVD
jgi:hypothetical protein